ncbi:MAG TPA: DNA internalization-related competence protein ComEC/Rec2 [Clostridia bacterium]|nr:DNA internalization-related competence protein ComEC/Rec2 [Clostridia bacterium]
MEQRILAKATGLYILGLLIAWFIPVPAQLSLLLVLLFLGLGIFLYRSKKTVNFYLIITFIALGAFRMGVVITDPGQLTAFVDKADKVNITATVISPPQPRERGCSFYCRVNSAFIGNTELKLSEKTVVFVNYRSSDFLTSGQRVLIEGTIDKPEGRENFGGFSYQNYLLAKGIHTVVYADKIVIFPNKSGKFNFLTLMHQIKNKLATIIFSSLGEQEGGLLACLLLGDKTHLAEQIRLDYLNSGLSHVLAVSGLHVGVLAVFLDKIKDRFSLNRIIGSIIVALTVIVYCLIVNTTSALRAGIMFVLLILARTNYRSYDLITSLFAAALIILLIWPGAILEVGFQLSFGATLGLAAVYSCLVEKLQADTSLLKQSLSLSIGATLGTLPIIGYHFYQLPLISLLANIVVVPLVGLTVILGWIAVFIGLLIPGAGKFVFFVLKPFLEGMQILPRFFASRPLLLYLFRLPIWFIFFYYLFLIYPKILFQGLDYIRKNRKKTIILIIFVFVFIGISYNYAVQKLTVTFLAIGNGDCCYLTLPGGKNMLVDAGSEVKFINGETRQDSDVLITYLKQRGVRKINYLILSHPHLDHYGSLSELAANFKLEHIFISADPDWNEILKGLDSKIHIVQQGTSMNLGNQIRGYFLHPPDRLVVNTGSDSNNNSLVFRLDYRNFSLLFTGDIEAEAERMLPGEYLQSTVLKVPHHGSATSTSEFLIEKVKPKYAVVSSDDKHFDLNAEKRLQDSGALILATYKHGAVRFITDGQKVKIITVKEGKI